MRIVWAGLLVMAWAAAAWWVADWRSALDTEALRAVEVHSARTWRMLLTAAGAHLAATLGVFLVGGGIVGALGFAQRSGRRMPWWLLSLPAAALAAGAAARGASVPGAGMSAWSMVHAAVGAWAALTGAWLVSGRILRRLGILLVVLPILAAGWLGWRIVPAATATEPLPVQTPEVTAAEKRALADRLRHPRLVDAETRLQELELSERAVNQLLRVVSEMDGDRWALRADLQPGHARLSASRKAAGTGSDAAHQTAALTARITIREGALDLSLISARFGDWVAPRWLLGAIMPDLLRVLRREPRVVELLEATERLALEADAVRVRIHGRALDNDFLNRLTGSEDDELTEAAAGYARHLLELGRRTPRDKRTLARFVSAAFERAAEQTGPDGDAVFENRAALVALGVVIGHAQTQRLTGTLLDQPGQIAWAGALAATVHVRDRNDWARHFAISALLTAAGNAALSDAVGLFKEEIDSAAGGSGFSFADLLADRAGTRLAARATAGVEEARRVQHILRAVTDPAVFFPEAGDLPEGIPDAQLQSEYGGVGGEKYRAIMRSIESRLDQTPVLR